jgi:hypothetical protein
MSPALRLSTIVMLGAGGIFTGGVVWYAWERVWIWRRLELAAYAVELPPFPAQGRSGAADPARHLCRGGRRLRLAHRRNGARARVDRDRAAGDHPRQLDSPRRADQQPVPAAPGRSRPARRRAPAVALAPLPPRPHGPCRRRIRRSRRGDVLRTHRAVTSRPFCAVAHRPRGLVRHGRRRLELRTSEEGLHVLGRFAPRRTYVYVVRPKSGASTDNTICRCAGPFSGATGLEPASSGVIGRHGATGYSRL